MYTNKLKAYESITKSDRWFGSISSERVLSGIFGSFLVIYGTFYYHFLVFSGISSLTGTFGFIICSSTFKFSSFFLILSEDFRNLCFVGVINSDGCHKTLIFRSL